jgi:Zn-dependent protease with chaperone function
MQQRRRLNLFAHPPETNALFSMLILASLMLALFSGNVWRMYWGIQDPLDSIGITSQRFEVTRAFLSVTCLSGIATLGTLGLAVLFYLRHPSRIRRRRNVQALSEKDRVIQEQISNLSSQAGVNSPTVEMPLTGLKGSDAQAFGIGKKRSIALDGVFIILMKTKPDIFNALLRHELAHFANNDISRSYFSDALWKSIRWLLVIPFLFMLAAIVIQGFYFGIFGGGDLELAIASIPGVIGLFIQWGFVLGIAGLIWARLLRTREFYADWRAAIWGSENGLQQILREEAEKRSSKTRFGLWKFHPDAKERLEALERPEILFQSSPTIFFLAGLLLSFIFTGLYFSFAAFITFAESILILRDSASGLLYWILTTIWWAGFAFLILLLFGLTGWLVNAVILPQVQKQTILDLLHKQSGWLQYGKLLIPSFILVTGIELGFFMTPFSQLAPNDLLGILIELFIILPILTCFAWWYLIYIKFVAARLLITQAGKDFSVWRSRFISMASSLWIFFFLIPGILLTRFLDESFREVFTYLSVGWLIFTLLFSPLIFGATWTLIKLLFENQSRKCPHCGKPTQRAAPAIESCEHCGGVLGEWLFISEQS